jgi:hypothetical protein
MAQKYLSELMHEQGEHVDPGTGEQTHVNLLECGRIREAIAADQTQFSRASASAIAPKDASVTPVRGWASSRSWSSRSAAQDSSTGASSGRRRKPLRNSSVTTSLPVESALSRP